MPYSYWEKAEVTCGVCLEPIKDAIRIFDSNGLIATCNFYDLRGENICDACMAASSDLRREYGLEK